MMCGYVRTSLHHTASRVRGVVAGIPFEQFHKYSADIIRSAVFGKDEAGSVREELLFSSNNLVSYQYHVCVCAVCLFMCVFVGACVCGVCLCCVFVCLYM